MISINKYIGRENCVNHPVTRAKFTVISSGGGVVNVCVSCSKYKMKRDTYFKKILQDRKVYKGKK